MLEADTFAGSISRHHDCAASAIEVRHGSGEILAKIRSLVILAMALGAVCSKAVLSREMPASHIWE